MSMARKGVVRAIKGSRKSNPHPAPGIGPHDAPSAPPASPKDWVRGCMERMPVTSPPSPSIGRGAGGEGR